MGVGETGVGEMAPIPSNDVKVLRAKSKFLSDSDSEPVFCFFFCYDSFVKMESGKRKYLELWKRRTPCSTPHGASILRRKEFRAVTSLRLHTTKQFQEGAESEFVYIQCPRASQPTFKNPH